MLVDTMTRAGVGHEPYPDVGLQVLEKGKHDDGLEIHLHETAIKGVSHGETDDSLGQKFHGGSHAVFVFQHHFRVVIPETQKAEGEQNEERKPYVAVSEVVPQQYRHGHAQEDE